MAKVRTGGARLRVRMDFDGAEEIKRRMERIAVDTVQDYIKESGKAGAEIIQQDAAQRVTTGPHAEHLKDHIVVEVVKERDAVVEVAIGPDKDRWYGRLVEKGHAIVRVVGRFKKGGRRTYRILEVLGNVPPHPFLRPAFDTKRQEAYDKAREVLRRRLGL